MKLDAYVQQLKGKKVFAMVTAGKSQVDFYYEENNEIQVKTILMAKKYEAFKQYAAVCGLLWDGIGIGKGWEIYRNFQNGRLFVPLRGPKGVMYVDFRYLGKFVWEDGRTYLELKNGQRLESCKNTTGNKRKIEEAKKIATDISIIKSPIQATCPVPPAQETHPAATAPVVRNVSFDRLPATVVEKKKKPKKRPAFKEGALKEDLLDAFPSTEETCSGQWKHVEDIDRNSFAYRTMQSKKKAELEEISTRFYELIAQCEGG